METAVIEIADIEEDVDNQKRPWYFLPSEDKELTILEYPEVAVTGYRYCSIGNGEGFRLKPEIYLNDNLIDFSITHFALQVLETVNRKERCYHFSSLFMTRLREHASLTAVERYQVVKTWTYPVRIKNCQVIMKYLETSTINDIEQAFSMFSSQLDYTVEDILEKRLNMRILIESLMPAYRSVRLAIGLPVSCIATDINEEGEDF